MAAGWFAPTPHVAGYPTHSGSHPSHVPIFGMAYPNPNSSAHHGFEEQFVYTRETTLRQDTNFVMSGLDRNESDLYNLQLVFLIDISGSMEAEDVDPEGTGKTGLLGRKWTRFDNMVKILRNMSKDLFQYDKDKKLPCYFFNGEVKRFEITDPNLLVAQVRQFRPTGSTALHLALKQAIDTELNDVENFLFIVFTDGEPDNPRAVEDIIQREIHARDRSGDRINLLFLRFGDHPDAMRFLQAQDDHPVHGMNVDHKSDNAAYVLGPKLLVLNALYEKIENDPAWIAKLAACQ